MRTAIALVLFVAACGFDRSMPPPASDAAPPSTLPNGWTPELGAHPDGDGVTFRVASTRATRVELWLYAAPTNAPALATVAMTADANGVWTTHVASASLPSTIYYGYRVWGPNWPYDPTWQPGTTIGWIADVDTAGNRMNPNKLVFDPYALELSHDPTTPTQGDGTAYATGDHRALDSAPIAPKGIVVPPQPFDPGARPVRALADDVIYEVHVRGFTEADPAAGACAGTYAGAATRAAYLADLGVTAIELLPLAETPNDRNDVDPTSDSGDNYWGYSTLNYFAPDRRYACDRSPGGPTREVAAMVRAFHDHGIKVFVDVVYNHTAEGGGGSLLSFRGLDNAGYYQLDRAGTGYTNNNGVGADLAGDKPLVAGLVLDSLRYWKDGLGVDGFRFDLAPVLGNTCGPGCFTFDPDGLPRMIADLIARPADGGVGADLIAEPWAVTNGGYAVGKFPTGWSEWNDQYRDPIREDQNQLGGLTPGGVIARVSGSPSIYQASGRTPAAGVSYLVSHDGLTLHDLYACNGSNNGQAWPYGPSNGGTTDNHAWDHGSDPVAQRQATRTGLALMLVSAGVPMITGGDELSRTLRCNNNSYNLDSPATWLDWTAQGDAPWTFAQRFLRFRAQHPALRPHAWLTGAQVTWLDGDGHTASDAYKNDATKTVVAWRLDGTALGDPDAALYVAYNRGAAGVTVTLPAPPTGLAWYRAADTSAGLEPGANFAAPGTEYRMHQAMYGMAARSLVIFVARP